MGVSENSGTPKWMVKIMENPIKMGWFGGTTIFGNIHIPWSIEPLSIPPSRSAQRLRNLSRCSYASQSQSAQTIGGHGKIAISTTKASKGWLGVRLTPILSFQIFTACKKWGEEWSFPGWSRNASNFKVGEWHCGGVSYHFMLLFLDPRRKKKQLIFPTRSTTPSIRWIQQSLAFPSQLSSLKCRKHQHNGRNLSTVGGAWSVGGGKISTPFV